MRGLGEYPTFPISCWDMISAEWSLGLPVLHTVEVRLVTTVAGLALRAFSHERFFVAQPSNKCSSVRPFTRGVIRKCHCDSPHHTSRKQTCRAISVFSGYMFLWVHSHERFSLHDSCVGAVRRATTITDVPYFFNICVLFSRRLYLSIYHYCMMKMQ